MDAFDALAEPRRRKVLEILAHRGQLSASDISDEFDVTPQAISQHLRVLREAQVLQMTKQAQRRLYSINPETLLRVQRWAMEVGQLWGRRLDRLDKALKENGS